MAQIENRGQNKNGSWSFRIKVYTGQDVDGKRTFISETFVGEPSWSEKTTKKKAEAYASNLERDYKNGIVSDKKYTFHDYALMVISQREKTGIIKYTTAERYRDSVSKTDKYIGSIKLGDLRADHLDQMYAAMLSSKNQKTGKPISKSTVHEHHTMVRMVLNNAYKKGLVPVNVADRATPPSRDKAEIIYYTEDEAKQILNCFQAEPIKWRLIVNLLLISGIRKGELCGMKWENVNFEKNTIYICNQVQYDTKRGLFEETPKTKKSIRTITLPDEIMQMMKEYKAYQNEERLRLGEYFVNYGYVFTQDNGEALHPDSINHEFLKMEKKYNLPHLRPHSFRHTMATHLFANGNMDVVTVSARLGHAQPSTTMNIYAHAIPSKDEKCSELLGNLFFKAENMT